MVKISMLVLFIELYTVSMKPGGKRTSWAHIMIINITGKAGN